MIIFSSSYRWNQRCSMRKPLHSHGRFWRKVIDQLSKGDAERIAPALAVGSMLPVDIEQEQQNENSEKRQNDGSRFHALRLWQQQNHQTAIAATITRIQQ